MRHIVTHHNIKRRNRSCVGIIGGSFNPFHEGHLHIAKYAKKKLGLKQVWFLIAKSNPFKAEVDNADLNQRITQINKALKPTFCFKLFVQHSMHTIDNIQKYRSMCLNFIWLSGLDSFMNIPSWKKGNDISKNCKFLVYPRGNIYKNLTSLQKIRSKRIPERRIKLLKNKNFKGWALVQAPKYSISSTQLRSINKQN